MTFLQLVQRTMRECDVLPAVSTVTGQTGQQGDFVNWVAGAYDDICSRHESWKFLRSAMTVNTVSSKQAYDVADFSDTRVTTTEVGFGRWLRDTFRIYLQSAGVGGETFLPFCGYDSFRNQFMFNTLGVQATQPICFTIRPDDDAILLGPKPNGIYVVTGEYEIEANALNDDADEPLFPTRYHMAIVWLAAQRYALKEGDTGMYVGVEREFNKQIGPLELNQLPEVLSAGPLA